MRHLRQRVPGHRTPPFVVPSTLVEDFESLTGFTLTGSGAMSLDTANRRTGASGLKLATTAAGAASLIATKPVSLPFSVDHVVSVRAYLSNPAGVTAIIIYLTGANGQVLTLQWNGGFTVGVPGWVDLALHVRDAVAPAGWRGPVTQLQVRAAFTAAAAAGDFVTFDSLRFNARGRAKILIGNDIANSTLYTVLFPFLRQRGLRMTSYVTPNFIGTAGYCTLAQLQDMYAYGFDMANHGYNDVDLTSYSAESDAQAQLTNAASWLVGNAMPRAAYHASLPLTKTSPQVLQAIQGAGISSMRGTGGSGVVVAPAKDDLASVLNMGGITSNATTIALSKANVDQAIRTGGWHQWWVHDTPYANPSAGITADKALASLDYIWRQKQAGLCDVLTITQAYATIGSGR